ncbi:uncharacterized protein LOC134705976 [Mytilus trossulus]|uniref:uncharacterized protein LOC134705976 n=1 Tax=Mytilus trossulus TaxID=6551 RepID=UPI0030077364
MSKIGDLSIKANPPTLTLTMNSDKQAQKMISTISKSINDINPTFLKKNKIPNLGRRNIITGCSIMPTGEIVLVDDNTDSLIIFNENGLFDCEMPVSALTVDATYIDENTVAVTRSENPSHIVIFNIRNKKIVKMIKTSGQWYGITNRNGKLVYYETGSGIQTVDVNNESTINTVVKIDDENHWNYVATLKDKIYHANYYSDTVTCYTITGQKVWEYKDESILKEPRGVTIDNDSNVYVASRENNRIVVISPDGKYARELLGGEHKIEEPYCIHFDQNRNILLISNSRGTAFLYKIT